MPDSNKDIITFSVIIPAYNASKTIERAINSCLSQSYLPSEIIVINDAGTDNTEEILQTKYSSQIKYIRLSKNSGSSVARNAGLDASTSNYIAFLDADDLWHPEKLAIVKTILEYNTGIRFLYHAYTLADVDTISLPSGATLYKLPFIKLLHRNLIATPCVILRNDKKFRFNAKMRYSEDYDLWLRIGYRTKIYFINTQLTQLGRPILSEGGTSHNKWQMRKGEMLTYTRLVKLNPLFLLILPFLYTYSLLKHLVKAVTEQ
jgi:glycosyltransferase involved in cell wall biosynthesis